MQSMTKMDYIKQNKEYHGLKTRLKKYYIHKAIEQNKNKQAWLQLSKILEDIKNPIQ
jgi:hypothetical protein